MLKTREHASFPKASWDIRRWYTKLRSETSRSSVLCTVLDYKRGQMFADNLPRHVRSLTQVHLRRPRRPRKAITERRRASCFDFHVGRLLFSVFVDIPFPHLCLKSSLLSKRDNFGFPFNVMRCNQMLNTCIMSYCHYMHLKWICRQVHISNNDACHRAKTCVWQLTADKWTEGELYEEYSVLRIALETRPKWFCACNAWGHNASS